MRKTILSCVCLVGALACSGDSGSGDGDAGLGVGGGGMGGGRADAGTDVVPCTISWTGAAMGTAPCKGTTTMKFLGIKTGATVNWLVINPTKEPAVSFSFILPKPPTATTYVGTARDDLFCTASISNTSPLSVWNVSSKPSAGGAPGGICSITLTSVTDESSGSTSTYVVHGTATATLTKTSDMSTVTLTVTF